MRYLIFSCLLFSLRLNAQTDTLSIAQIDSMFNQTSVDTTNQDAKAQVFTIPGDEVEETSGAQNISTLLQSSRDVFTSMATFNLGNGRFRMRGYSPENTYVIINGIKISDPENGWAPWSLWGGLNDVTRFGEIRTGIAPSDNVFSPLGGYSSMETRASGYRKGHKLAYTFANGTFTNRLTYTYASGLNEKGWAFVVSGSGRYAAEGNIQGTFFQSAGYFVSVEKKINENHSINFTGFGAPTMQGRSAPSVQEAYDLTGNNLYNSQWGFQNGVARNARILNVHKPFLNLTHYWTINEKSKLTTSAYYTFGKEYTTSLNWLDANDPRPDYYRNLPSYSREYDPNKYNVLTDKWKTDLNTRQINWDQFYQSNYMNLYTVENANGIIGNNVTGKRARYILEARTEDLKQGGYNIVYNSKVGGNSETGEVINISAGLTGQLYQNRYYKTVNDLLGADFWLDVDRFANESPQNTAAAQNDINVPNKIIKKGDVFGYDYNMNVISNEAFVQGQVSVDNLEYYAALNVGQTAFWRSSALANGKFPTTSAGTTEAQNFITYGLKAGALYKIDGRNSFTANALIMTRPPDAQNAYTSVRTRNDLLVSSLPNENLLGVDVNYFLRFPNLKIRASYYYTQINNQLRLQTFYHDQYNTFVNYIMRGVDELHHGIELGAEQNITSAITASAAFAWGQHLYNSRPQVTVTRDNSADILATDKVVYLQNFRIGSMPQTAGSVSIKYNGKKFWWVSANFNYFGEIYVEPNPDKRTAESLTMFVTTDPQWQKNIAQQKLKDAYTLDLNAGKSFKYNISGKNYFLNLNLRVANLLNNQDFAMGGFEQLRFDAQNPDKFPPRISYHLGITYFLTASIKF